MPTLDLKPKYNKSVSEPWFSLISLGIKSIEGRLDKGDFQNMAIGDLVK
jgi:ASC-1-like (ASCH) protein